MPIKNLFLAFSVTVLLSGCSSFGIDGPFLKSHKLEAEERAILVTDQTSVLPPLSNGHILHLNP